MHRLRNVVSLLALACLCYSYSVRAAEPTGPPATGPAATGPAAIGPLVKTITSQELNALIATQSPAAAPAGPQDDAAFLRRATFDLTGRPPTVAEQQEFAAQQAPQKYELAIDRLLASPDFGVAWADYWSDTIAYHVPPPELTYLNYAPFKAWLAERLNNNVPWGETVRALIVAEGKVSEQPAAAFVGYHQARPTNLAAEVSRLFLGQQIGCAECHDHPFDHWKRTQFHELAAFFARTKSKLSQNDSLGTVVSATDKGEYRMSDSADPRAEGTTMLPGFLTGNHLQKGRSDAQRRQELAAWVTAPDNPWFAKAYVNRIWGRLLGRGFYEPVDDLGDSQSQLWPEVHESLAAHFVASHHDVKDLFRLLMNTAAYRQSLRPQPSGAPAGQPLRLRGDEVFAALVLGLELPNVTPPRVEPTAAIRFPPPPKSTRELVSDAFGTDPSLSPVDAPRTVGQALWMMNNEQLQKQIDASPNSGTMLARLLAEQADDKAVCEQLFRRVLSRGATEAELRIALEHVAGVGQRGPGFEDLLWGLVNSTEFTNRR